MGAAFSFSVGDALIVRHASGEVSARVAAITHRLDLETLENTPADRLVLNDIGRVELALASTLVVDEYTVNRAGGSAIATNTQFVMVDRWLSRHPLNFQLKQPHRVNSQDEFLPPSLAGLALSFLG